MKALLMVLSVLLPIALALVWRFSHLEGKRLSRTLCQIKPNKTCALPDCLWDNPKGRCCFSFCCRDQIYFLAFLPFLVFLVFLVLTSVGFLFWVKSSTPNRPRRI